MILRLVLGVVLTATLLSVATPLLATASADAADSDVDRQLSGLGERLQTLVETNDPTVGEGARHVTELTLPGRSLTSAGVDRLRFYGRDGVGLATWRVGDRATRRTRLVGVPIRAVGGSLTLRQPGSHRLVFELRSRSDGPVLTVRRLGGRTDA